VSHSAAARAKLSLTFGGPCSYRLGTSAHTPEGNGFTYLGNAHDDLAVATMGDFGARTADARAAWQGLERQIARCPGARQLTSYADPSGAQGRTFQVTPDSPGSSAYVWIASTGHSVGVLTISVSGSLLPSADDRPVADALVAALETPASYTPAAADTGGVRRTDPAKTLGQVWAQTLEPALAGWTTPWIARLPNDASEARPNIDLPDCVGAPEDTAPGDGMTTNVGTDGFQWVNWFPAESGAVQAVGDLRQALLACSTPYDVHTVTLPSGRPVVVAVGSQQVLWFTRVASHVLVLQLPAGDVAPPDAVSVQVGQVLEQVLEKPAETTVSPDESTPVPDWLAKRIADAPTFGP
jgi:hypothetical protein